MTRSRFRARDHYEELLRNVVQGVAGGCNSVRNPPAGVDGNRTDSLNHSAGNTLRDPVFCSGAVGDDSPPITPDLSQVIKAWTTLPPAIREAVLDMLRAAE